MPERQKQRNFSLINHGTTWVLWNCLAYCLTYDALQENMFIARRSEFTDALFATTLPEFSASMSGTLHLSRLQGTSEAP